MNALQANLRRAALAVLSFLILAAATTKDTDVRQRHEEYRALKRQAEEVARGSLGSVHLAKDAKRAFDRFLSGGMQRLQKEGATDQKVQEAMSNLKQYCDALKEKAERSHEREVTLKNFKDVTKSLCLFPFW